MNNGAFGENFPYSNSHDLNMDWIIKIAKDFLDQYTHIQETIDNGLTALEEKATNLEALLQAWYDTHSEDIANQLADALEDLNNWYTEHQQDISNQLATAIASFNTSAEQKATETIASIPDDYTTLFNKALKSSGIIISPQNVSQYPTLNNLPINSIFLVLATATPSISGNPFENEGYTIITTGQAFDPNNAPYGGEIQIAIPFNSTNHSVKTRSYNGSNWTGWTMDIANCVKSLDIYVTNTSQYSDVHDFPNNSIILVKNEGLAIANKPYPYQDFLIITLGHSRLLTDYTGKTQIAIPYNSSNDHSIRYCSFNGNTWTTWSTDYQIDFIKSYGYITGTTYTDIDTLPINSFIGFASQSIANRPFNGPFLIYTTGISGRLIETLPYGGELQIAFPFYPSAGTPRYRVFDGTAWSKWSPNKCELYVNPSNFIEEIINHQDIYDELIVHMRHGVYNLFDTTHNETFWKAHRKATRYLGFCLKNTTLIADSLVQINALYTGTDDDILENFSVFNIIDNVHLENLFVTAENICYIVHDDTPIVSVYTSKAVIKNCIFTHNGSSHTFVNGAPICYGAGFSTATMRHIENCIMKNPARTFAISFHSSTDSNGYVTIKDCVLISATLRLAPVGTGGTGTILFTNNKIGSQIINLSSPFIIHEYNNVI